MPVGGTTCEAGRPGSGAPPRYSLVASRRKTTSLVVSLAFPVPAGPLLEVVSQVLLRAAEWQARQRAELEVHLRALQGPPWVPLEV